MSIVHAKFIKNKKTLYEELIRPQLYDFAGIYKSKLRVITALKCLGLEEYLEDEITCLKQDFVKSCPLIDSNYDVNLSVEKVSDGLFPIVSVNHYGIVIRFNETVIPWDFNGNNDKLFSLFLKGTQTKIKTAVKKLIKEIRKELEDSIEELNNRDKSAEVINTIQSIQKELDTTYKL